MAQSSFIRLLALQDLHRILSVDATSTSNHSVALKHGADRLLSWQLICNLQEESVDMQILLEILDCLEKLWRQSRPDRMNSSVLGLLDVLPWLVHMWQRFPDHDPVVKSTLQILRIWSKVKNPRLKSRLVRSGVIDCIRQEYRRGASSRERLLLALSLLKDLTFRSSFDDKEFLYANTKDVVLENCQNNHCGVAEAMSAALWNLALEPILGRKMAQDQELWDAVQRLWKTSTQTVGVAVHRNVSSAVGMIVASIVGSTQAAPNLFLDQLWLLPALLEVLSDESDKDWRRRCMRTIRCLASCDWGRAFLWDHVPSVESLFMILLRVLQNGEDDTDTRVQACQVIASVLPFKRDELVPLGPCLETSLIRTLNDRNIDEKLTVALSQALTVILGQSPWKRASTCFSATSMERIRIALDKSRRDATCHITLSSLMIQLLQQHTIQRKVAAFASTPVLESLSLLLESVGPEFELSRRNAVHMVTLLSSDPSSKKLLAENEGLLSSLVSFCLMSNGPLKEDAKNAILRLVPEL